MSFHELVVNLHIHTSYSDGTASHKEIAQAALRAGIDVVIITDHNIWVKGLEGFYKEGDHQVLLLVGEEIHDQTRNPQKSHLLVLGAQRELAHLSHDLQRLINTVLEVGGLSFIAHPDDPAAPAVGETDITWVDWNVRGYTGIELWNGFSEFKTLLKTKLHAIFYTYNPVLIARSPLPETLQKWDELLSQGQRVVAIGGSDAHALHVTLGPLHKIIFPYEFHFQGINTHILVPESLSGDVIIDNRMILEAFKAGRVFIGYDLPESTRGFRFTAHGMEKIVQMGETIPEEHGVTFQIRLPRRAECLLLKDGKVIRTWHERENCVYNTTEPGIYRTEVYIEYKGKRRGWIYSNPIYVQDTIK